MENKYNEKEIVQFVKDTLEELNIPYENKPGNFTLGEQETYSKMLGKNSISVTGKLYNEGYSKGIKDIINYIIKDFATTCGSCTDVDCIDCLIENLKIKYRDYLKE